MSDINKYAELLGRILMALIFLMAGVNKISGYADTQGYMESVGVPGMLLPLVILLEIAGAVAIIVGWQTRLWALALAGFTLLAAAIFHNNLGDHMQMILFMKNIAIAGGFLVIFAHGAGEISVDARSRT